MKNKDLKIYLAVFISIFMLITLFGLFFSSVLFATSLDYDIENAYDYYKLGEWGLTVYGIKAFCIVILFVGWVSWLLLGVLIERKLKIQIFRRPFSF